MKAPKLAAIALACSGLSPLFGGETGEALGIKAPPTEAELLERMAARSNPLASYRDVEMLDRSSIKPREAPLALEGLLQRSTVISFNGHWTIVPKGAVLVVPNFYKGRVAVRPEGTLLPWNEFYARNLGWLHLQKVTMANARGEAPLSDEVLEAYQQTGRVVVAVLHQGPISMVRPAPPKEESPTTPETQS